MCFFYCKGLVIMFIKTNHPKKLVLHKKNLKSVLGRAWNALLYQTNLSWNGRNLDRKIGVKYMNHPCIAY